jgi:RNA polymerase sigma-54 factor
MYTTLNHDFRQTTLHLTQTMRLLELNTEELSDEITHELETNPVLQMLDEIRCPNCGRRVKALPCPACVSQHSGESPIVFLSPRLPGSRDAERADEPDELPAERIAQTESLAEHILRQVACGTNEAEQRIAANILARLDERGLLTDELVEIAAQLRVPLATVSRVLRLIQRADPPGVGTRDCRESLLVQLEVLGETASVPPLCCLIVSDHWQALTRRNYALIARGLRATLADVKAAVKFIRRNLTPYPARAWQDSGRGTHHLAREVFYEPDIIITHNPRPGGPLVVEVFTGMQGTLRLDPAIKAAIPNLDDEDRQEWSDYVERASLLIKCVQQRNNTMRRIAEIITVEQNAFILGSDADLRSLTRSSIAQRLCLHESTVSRAVANKSAALPNGRIVPLSIFFDRSLAVRDAVQAIVAGEDRCSPLSDTQIAELLKAQGYHVARRTVAKYRQMKNILAANLRGRELALAR